MTNTNIAIASNTPRRGVPDAGGDDTLRSIPVVVTPDGHPMRVIPQQNT
jgi:hypothetical protein